jgi:chemotaxis protein methyltransferase CheR
MRKGMKNPMADLKSFNSGDIFLEDNKGDDVSLIIDDSTFRLFSELIYKVSGIRLGSHKKGLLSSRLAKRLKRLEIGNFYDYYKRAKDDNAELSEMINCISTNTTNFFREQHHFNYLENKVLPELLKVKAAEKVIRIWSAGCSTGEEPYSIAVTACEALKDSKGWDIKILATDISTKVLDTARAGIYDLGELPDYVSADVRNSYFLKGSGENSGKIKMKDFVKEMIRFRRFNLKEPEYPFNRKFDIIFCRNVMIYFDEDMKNHVLCRFHRHLSDNGCLFLGHSETMIGRDDFMPVYITAYKKNEA